MGFAAPEQHGEMTQVDTRADVYGATAVMEWAATGSRYEQALGEVTRVGMAEDPGDRYEDISAWNSAVRQALTGPSSPSGIASGIIEDQPPGWAKPALAAVAGISLGFVVAAAFWYDQEPTVINRNTVDAVTQTTVEEPVTTESDSPTLPTAQTSESPPTTPEGASAVPTTTIPADPTTAAG